MSEVYVCIPCHVRDKVPDKEPRICIVSTRSRVSDTIEGARHECVGIWEEQPCDIVIIVRVDEILNAAIVGIFGHHKLASRYDLPGSVEQIDSACYNLAQEARLRADEYTMSKETV
jgi:hypothetical protein